MATDPLHGASASMTVKLRELQGLHEWNDAELARRLEAARRRILIAQARGSEIRNPEGYGLTLVASMGDEEIEELLAGPDPRAALTKKPSWVLAQEKSDAARTERLQAQTEATADAALPPSAELQAARDRQRKFSPDNLEAVTAARRRLGIPEVPQDSFLWRRLHGQPTHPSGGHGPPADQDRVAQTA